MADAPKILESDSLRNAFPKLNSAIDNANQAIKDSSQALPIANEAKITAYSVQEQFNQVVIEGDSSVEAAQARVDLRNTTFSTLKQRLDSYDSEFEQRSVNVKRFGAVGDGATDDTAAIQAAIDYVVTTYGITGATIFFPYGTFYFTEVKITTKHVTLTGLGTLKGTIKIKGIESANPLANNIPDVFATIEGLRFVHDWGNPSDAIVIHNTRGVTIRGCYFENYRYAIHGESIRSDIPYQQTSRVIITDCRFRNVDNAVRTSWVPYSANVPPTWRYNQHGDWQVKGCQAYFYSRGKTHFHFEGQDGLICSNNVLFHHLYSERSPNKEHNIYLKQSNFAIISNNDLFEAGYEAIFCEDMRSLIITNNNIAWPGQRDPRSGIYLEVADQSTYEEASIVVSGNNISFPTRHGVHVGYFVANIKVSDNTVTNIGNGKFYYGTTDINSISHYGIFVGDPNPTFTQKENVVVSNNFYDGILYQNRGITSSNFPFSFVQANRTFGNMSATARTVSGTLDLKTIITKNNNPFNQNFPFILKNVTGTLSDLLGDQNQVVTIICGTGTLTLSNGGTGSNKLNLGADVVLNSNQAITLQKTDTYWIRF